MKQLIAVCILLATSVGAAAQSVYKCEDERGNPVFSQQPCSVDAELVEIRSATLVGTSMNQGDWSAVRQGVRRDAIEWDIRRVQDRIEQHEDGLDRNLGSLRAQKARAANNLAGAAWQQSISTEMQAVSKRYAGKIEQERYVLDRLYSELQSQPRQ